MIKYCVIKPNNYDYDNLPILENKKKEVNETPYNKNNFDNKINYADLEKFKENIDEFVEIRECSNDEEDFMAAIQTSLNPKMEFMLVTEELYQSREYLYQMCFMDVHHEFAEDTEVNRLASALTNEKKALIGNVVILKIKLEESNEVALQSNFELEDLYFLLKSEMIRAGVIVHADQRFTQIYYNEKFKLVNMDKKCTLNTDNDNLFEDKNYEGYKESILKFDFNIYVRKSNTFERNEVPFNPLASKIYNMRVYGDALFVCKDFETDKYYDLFVEDLTDIMNVDISKRKLSETDNNDQKDKNNKKIFKSRYRILYNKKNN